jgi:L-glyceraldehyde 3-phosphate reductase
MQYRRCGRSGVLLPAVSIGAWLGVGGYVDEELSKKILFRAFDLGITHFDFADMYGSRKGGSEELFGTIAHEFPRRELVIATKGGVRMDPGPYGQGGTRKHIIEACEQSLKRMRLDHVDIYYSHYHDQNTPIDETLGSLETLVRQGKALYAGISNWVDPVFSQAAAIVRENRWQPLLIQQVRYNMLARATEQNVLPTAEGNGIGVIVYSPLAQGLLSDRYLNGVPDDSRAVKAQPWMKEHVGKAEILDGTRKLNEVAKRRNQTLAQMALAWLLKDKRVTSVLVGASSVQQIEDNVGCLKNLSFSAEELAEIETICKTLYS